MLMNFSENSSAVYINTKIKGTKVKVLIDSGAEITVINESLANKLRLKICKQTSDLKLIGANNSPLHISGFTLVEVELGQMKVIQKAIVVKNLSTDFLLGTDCLRQHGVIINFERNTLSIGKSSIKLITKEKQTNFCVSSANVIELKPFSSTIQWLKVPDDAEGPVYFEYENHIKGVDIKNGFFDLDEKSIPLIFTNRSNVTLRIGKGRHLGTACNVESVRSIRNVQQDISKSFKASSLLKFGKNLSKEQEIKIKELVDKYSHIFSSGDDDIGYHDKIKFNIDTGNERPIKSRPYRVPYAMQEEVDKMIEKMLSGGIISKSSSPWAAPIVIIKKKDGSNRFCIDYRKLNKITVKDNYPVPLIEETLDTLKGSCFFTSLDLASGYWQVALADKAKEKTAFCSRKGQFQFNVLPFGLSNAVSSFQRMMETVLEGLPNTKVYLDDILIHSVSFESHLSQLEKVFKRLEEANLKVKPSKCNFAKKEIKYLGFDVSSEGITPSRDRIKALLNYPRPTKSKEIKRFLGMASYYRKFIPHFSTLAEPINLLLKKSIKFVCEANFKKIIHSMVNPPILVYPDFKKEFILETDASNVGLGAVLAQKDGNGVNRAVGYASRMLKGAERNYTTTEIECLAIVWAVEQFRPYLYGRKFTIECDHNPLVYIDNAKNKTSRVSRWRLSLAEFQYTVVYKKGSLNVKADALSRIETELEVNSIKLEEKLDWDNFREKQERDVEVQSMVSKPGFYQEKGILFKKTQGRNRVVVPAELKELVLKMGHTGISGGHLGFKRRGRKSETVFIGRKCTGIQLIGLKRVKTVQ